MTPSELKGARHALGLSAEGFGRFVRVQSGRTVRRWEAGDAPIPGCVVLLLDLIDNVPEAKKYLGLSENRT